MALKKINENPKITDTILLEIETPDVRDCFVDNPYKVDSVKIYYIERDFLGINYGEYEKLTVQDKLQASLVKAVKNACDNPSEENLHKIDLIKDEITSSSQVNNFYYKDRVLVKSLGSESYPAWIGSDLENSSLLLTDEIGKFTYEWDLKGSVREGDYFVCWTWTPLPAGEKLSAHFHFSIEGDSLAVCTIPSHRTPEYKYETLLERYLPEMYKYNISNNDITPEVTDKLNLSIAKGFTFIEDMANQVIDLFDANALHESMLTYLSNLFAIKFKSSDPTLWRRQIKEAIPLFKKKGTLEGLKGAFAQSGMNLNSYTQYWQIKSPYTWTESFEAIDTHIFKLEKNNLITPDNINFALWIKNNDDDGYQPVLKDYVRFETEDDGTINMVWIADQLSASSMSLYTGDFIKVKYQYKEINSPYEQSIEDYISELPLMDQRNESDQKYPPKNWNIKLITENDPMFQTLVPVRHPFQDFLTFGHYRTEFAYSENIYNSDEYNGSTRPSHDPCRIDKYFVDPCGSCLSSSYSVDIGIEELSNDRMLESQDILREYTPFHAKLHSINFTGEVNEFVQSSVEHVEALINIDYSQNVISGNSNPLFHRNLKVGSSNWFVTRDDLTSKNGIVSNDVGVGYNKNIVFITPDHILSDLGLNPLDHFLEILSPSVNAGIYYIGEIEKSRAKVLSTVVEPLDKTAFTFKLSNVPYENFSSSITRNDLIKLSDLNKDLFQFDIKTIWDVNNTENYVGGAWKILIPAYSATPYEILDIKNGFIILKPDNTLPTVSTTGISYTLINDIGDELETSNSGNLEVKRIGRVNLNDLGIIKVEQFIKPGDFVNYNGNEYLILSIEGINLFIENYTDGDAIGVPIKIHKRLINNGIGYFGYQGLNLNTTINYESSLEIINGSNPVPENLATDNSKFKENYLFEIGGDFYKIISINGSEVVLNGREQDWGTLSNGGSSVTFSILHYEKNIVNVGFTVFDHLDRDGQDPVIREIYSTIDQNTAITALSMPKNSGIEEIVSHEEDVSIIIENRNGEISEGEL